MRIYLLSALLLLISALVAVIAPKLIETSENILVSSQIPQNNSQVAGVQKYNRPPSSKGLPTPAFSARSVLIKDLTTGTLLYQKESDIKLPIASTTKIMSALVASEYFKPNSVLEVRDSANIIGSKVGLFPDESLSFRSLLYGMLISSGNDAAYAIAENYPGGVINFVSSMNKKAGELNLVNTHFTNPAGFDDEEHFSSAADLAIISQEALKAPELARIFSTKETEVTSLDKKYKHQLSNLNKLLTSVSGVLGIKTGFTALAKENLITLVERDNHKILIVLLNSDDRFGETTKLIEWTYSNFTWSD